MTDASGDNIQQLINSLSSHEAVERQEARAELVGIGSPAVPALVGILAAPVQHVRWEAAKALAEIQDPSAAEPLVDALADENDDVRWVVAEALIALKGAAIKPLLTALAKSKLPIASNEGAHHVLHDLRKENDLAAIVDPVVQAFSKPEPESGVPVAAEKALQQGGF